MAFDPVDGHDLYDIELRGEYDMIILAGKSGVRESMDDPAGYWRNNVEVTKRLLERYPNTRMLIASSSAYEPIQFLCGKQVHCRRSRGMLTRYTLYEISTVYPDILVQRNVYAKTNRW